MNIQKHANYLRGFLDSISQMDTISKNQIEVLKTKLDELITAIEEANIEEKNFLTDIKTSDTKPHKYASFNPSPETIDDLPF